MMLMQTHHYHSVGKGNINRDAATTFTIGTTTIAIVADGVSSCRYGKQGADTAVESLARLLRESTLLNPDVLESAILSVHHALVKQYMGASLTTLTCLVCTPDTFFCASIGDSPCLKFHEDNPPILVTTDNDSRSRALLINGSTVTKGGMPVMQTGLTQALGQFEPAISVHHYQGECREGDTFLVASDGINYHTASKYILQNRYNEFAQWADFVAEESARNNDDATIAVINVRLPKKLMMAQEKLMQPSNITDAELILAIRVFSEYGYRSSDIKNRVYQGVMDRSNTFSADVMVRLINHIGQRWKKEELDKLIAHCMQTHQNKIANAFIAIIRNQSGIAR